MNDSFPPQTVEESLLIAMARDAIDPQWVFQTVRYHHPGDVVSVRQRSIGVIMEMMATGLVRAGDPFEYLWDCTTGEAMERVVRTWLAEAPDGMPEDYTIATFHLTESGEVLASEAIAKAKAFRAAENENGDTE